MKLISALHSMLMNYSGNHLLLFNLLPSEIASVSLENFNDTSSSFSIVNKNHRFVVSGINSELTGWDSSRVKRYLTYFTWIPFEAWAFDHSG